MAGPNPKFTETFKVLTDNYGDFIRLVRQDVIKYCSDRRPSIVEPVLPPEKPVPEFWFFIGLRTVTSSLTLAIRMDNLYLVGFKTQAGVWWEFNNERGKPLISNSKWLGFGGRYQDLLGQKGLETVTLGRPEMTMAVDYLAKYEPPKMLLQASGADPSAETKSKLAKLIIMLCEGLRFHTVYGTVDKNFNSYVTITELEGKQVNKWDKISKAVITWGKDPQAKFPELEKVGIKNKTDSEKIVLLVKDETAA